MIKALSFEKILPDEKKVQNIVVFLHGYGANGNDLLGIGHHWKEQLPNTLFISPNAPFKTEWSQESFQWFDLTSIAPEKIGEGIFKAGPYLNKFVDEVINFYSVSSEKIIFVGFSQGTMMALNHLCKREKPCAGIIGYSGLLYENEDFDNQIKSKFPINLFHGMDDEVINYNFSIKAFEKLKSLGFDIEHKLQKNLGHGIDEDGLNYGLKFIKKIFSI